MGELSQRPLAVNIQITQLNDLILMSSMLLYQTVLVQSSQVKGEVSDESVDDGYIRVLAC